MLGMPDPESPRRETMGRWQRKALTEGPSAKGTNVTVPVSSRRRLWLIALTLTPRHLSFSDLTKLRPRKCKKCVGNYWPLPP